MSENNTQQIIEAIKGLDQRVQDNSVAIQTLSTRVDQIQSTQERILPIVIDLQVKFSASDTRSVRVEQIIDETYNKIDGFMVMVNRHESELAALGAKC